MWLKQLIIQIDMIVYAQETRWSSRINLTILLYFKLKLDKFLLFFLPILKIKIEKYTKMKKKSHH